MPIRLQSQEIAYSNARSEGIWLPLLCKALTTEQDTLANILVSVNKKMHIKCRELGIPYQIGEFHSSLTEDVKLSAVVSKKVCVCVCVRMQTPGAHIIYSTNMYCSMCYKLRNCLYVNVLFQSSPSWSSFRTDSKNAPPSSCSWTFPQPMIT